MDRASLVGWWFLGTGLFYWGYELRCINDGGGCSGKGLQMMAKDNRIWNAPIVYSSVILASEKLFIIIQKSWDRYCAIYTSRILLQSHYRWWLPSLQSPGKLFLDTAQMYLRRPWTHVQGKGAETLLGAVDADGCELESRKPAAYNWSNCTSMRSTRYCQKVCVLCLPGKDQVFVSRYLQVF